MKKLVISLLGLLAVLLVIALVGPGLVDWNAYKSEIAAAVKQQTGRDLKIGGAISLQVLPSPQLSVSDVRLSNREGGTAADFVSLDSLRVHVALGPLLGGTVQVTSVTLIRPVIELERAADGSGNWIFEAPRQATRTPITPNSGGGFSPADLRLDSAEILDATLVWRDAVEGTEHRLEKLNARIEAGSLQGPFEARGDLFLAGQRMSYEAQLGRIDVGGAAPLGLALVLGDGQATVRVDGTVDMDGGPELRLDARLSAGDLKAAVATLNASLGQGADAPTALPDALAKAFSISGRIQATPKRVKVGDLVLQLGETKGRGKLVADLAPKLSIDAVMNFGRLDLADLGLGLAGPTSPLASPLASQSNAGTTTGASEGHAPTPFALPADISATLEVTADAVKYRNGNIRQLRLESDLVDGTARINVLTAQLPGGSNVTLTGAVTAPDGVANFNGRVDLVSDNLRAALDWLGISTAGIAPDRLRSAAFGADIIANPESVQLANWSMDLDSSKASGGLHLLLRERPAFGLSLVVDRINLDGYLPAGDASATESANAKTGSAPVPAVNPLALLTGFDANLSLRFNEVTYQQTSVRDTRLDATIENGALTVRDFKVADLGGASFSVNGGLSGIGAVPNGDLRFSLDAKSLPRLARLAGIEPTEEMRKVGGLKASGRLTGGIEALKLDAKLRALKADFSIRGDIQPLAAEPVFDLRMDLKHRNFVRLVRVFAPDAVDGLGNLGPLSAKAHIKSDGARPVAVDLATQLGEIQVKLKGEIDTAKLDPGLNLRISLVHPEMVSLLQTVAPDYKAGKAKLGVARLSSRLTGDTVNLQLPDLALELGPTKLTGAAGIALSGTRPKVELTLVTPEIDLDAWLPADAPKPKGIPAAVPVTASGREWSRDRIDTSGLLSTDASFDLKAAKVIWGAYRVDDAQLSAVLDAGVLTLNQLAGGLFGGKILASGALAHAKVPTLSIDIAVENADIRQAAMAAAEAGQVSGVLDYKTKLQSKGATEMALVSALSGTGEISARDGEVDGFDLPAISARLAALDRATDFVNLMQQAMDGGKTPFRSLKGSYTIVDGVLRSEDIELDSEAAAGRSTAVINLPPQEMDLNSRFWLTQHENSPPVGIRMVGPIHNPRQVFDIDKLQAYVLQRMVQRGILRRFGGTTSGTGGQDTTTATPSAVPSIPRSIDSVLKQLVPTQPKQVPAAQTFDQATQAQPAPAPAPATAEVKPEDALKGILKGLLK